MYYHYITLRLIHIFAGVFWAGASIYLAMYVIPTVKALPAEGAKFMQQLSRTNKLPLVMFLAGTLTVLSGIDLFRILSNGFNAEWFSTSTGITFSIGGTLAIIAYIIGLTINLPTVKKIAALGKAAAEKGGPPSPETMVILTALRNKLFAATNFIAVLLAITVLTMSVGKYL